MPLVSDIPPSPRSAGEWAVPLDAFDPADMATVESSRYAPRKRMFDLGCVILLLPIALPLIALAGIGILVSMGPPILFIQARVGRDGRVFDILKLRTMRPAAVGEPMAPTGVGDPRVTPLGRWLRRFRIDELPQLWNVAVGDMSFIGPRPEWTVLAEAYGAQEPSYPYRHRVRPGITGWAQVMGPPATDLAQTRLKLAYDLFYIRNMSLTLDLRILVRTVATLVGGGGAA
jgi:lipopolysaccharide/colanic/teichoic acid biosynthesis glycosyltransferase